MSRTQNGKKEACKKLKISRAHLLRVCVSCTIQSKGADVSSANTLQLRHSHLVIPLLHTKTNSTFVITTINQFIQSYSGKTIVWFWTAPLIRQSQNKQNKRRVAMWVTLTAKQKPWRINVTYWAIFRTIRLLKKRSNNLGERTGLFCNPSSTTATVFLSRPNQAFESFACVWITRCANREPKQAISSLQNNLIQVNAYNA